MTSEQIAELREMVAGFKPAPWCNSGFYPKTGPGVCLLSEPLSAQRHAAVEAAGQEVGDDDDPAIGPDPWFEISEETLVHLAAAAARLLDEREALLTALKAFAPFAEKRGACTAPQCVGSYLALAEAYRDAQAVIAKVEVP